nr:Crp/Fnr family transcriptional regulator [Roseospira navarrensis]
MDQPTRTDLVRRFSHRRFKARQVICDITSQDRDVWFILQGRVTVSIFARNGREIAFAELGPGQHFGEIAAIDGHRRSAAVTARTDCEVLVLSAERFHEIVMKFPDVAWRIMVRLTTLVRTSNERLQSFSTQSVTQRVCQELINLAMPSQAVRGAHIIHPVPTQADLGNRVGASRETVARVLLDLAHDGFVIRKGRTLTIPTIGKLEALVDDRPPGLEANVA